MKVKFKLKLKFNVELHRTQVILLAITMDTLDAVEDGAGHFNGGGVWVGDDYP